MSDQLGIRMYDANLANSDLISDSLNSDDIRCKLGMALDSRDNFYIYCTLLVWTV